MNNCGYICSLKNVREHPNADRLQLAECFQSTVIVGLSMHEGQKVVFFPTDLQLGKEFAEKNNLLRRKDENGKEIGGFLDWEKRNIKAIKLRGEKSDGLALPLSSLQDFTDINKLQLGDQISSLGGFLICEKYIPKTNQGNRNNKNNKQKEQKKKQKEREYPIFFEHIDTNQLAYNIGDFKKGDLCYITLKIDGTSARESLTIKKEIKKQNCIQRFFNKLLKKESKYTTSWDYVSGSRRVTLDGLDGGFYGSNEFRKKYHDFFKNKLQKGETVYFEIAGYINETTPIMPISDNKQTKDKKFIKQYGDTTVFSYGCDKGENRGFIYRITLTNEDGYTVDLPTEIAQQRAEVLGMEFVPILDKFFYTTEEDLWERVNRLCDDVDPIGKTHLREGIVIRNESKGGFKAYKHKNFMYKVLRGIAIANLEDNNTDDISDDILSEM